MILSELFDELARREFQDPDTGNLFFPAYIYTYNPSEEYEIRNEINLLKDRLIRPDIFQESFVLNIFNEFVEFLKIEKLGDETLFDLFSEQEFEDPKEAEKNLAISARSKDFLRFLNDKIVTHFNLPSKNKKVYVLIHGFGSIFPYLRASEFMKRFEEFLVGYKIIVFYPGEYKDNHFHLFNEINNESIYRATLLNQRALNEN